MYTIDWTKFATILLVILAVVVLSVTHNMVPEAVASIISAALGYVFGNGHGIATLIKAQNAVKASQASGGDNSVSQ